MRQCPACDFHNVDSRKACLKCGTALVHRADLALEPRRPLFGGAPPALRRALGRLQRRAARALEVPLPENVPHRFPLVAAFLGLVPGLGQLYNHQPRKLLYLLPATAAGLILSIHFITTPCVGNVFIAATLLVLMLSYADALVTAARINGQYFTFRNLLAALTYPIFLLGFFGTICAVMAWLQWPLFTLFYMGHDYMRPAIRRGDRICGEAVTYFFRDPKPGEVVHYDPPGFSAEKTGSDSIFGNDRYLINPQNGWERVMAVGGETLESRNGVFYVNGKRLSREYYPLITDQIPETFKMECPPGKFIVLITAAPEQEDIINSLKNGPGNSQVPLLKTLHLIGWEEACCVGKTYKEAGMTKRTFYDRAWFRYHPSARRCFFQARGPRFVANGE